MQYWAKARRRQALTIGRLCASCAAMANLFVNPLHGTGFATLFATHPPAARAAPQPRRRGHGVWETRPRGPWGSRSGDTV
jgi:hypothetical protein